MGSFPGEWGTGNKGMWSRSCDVTLFPPHTQEEDGLEQGKEIKQEGRDRDPNRDGVSFGGNDNVLELTSDPESIIQS